MKTFLGENSVIPKEYDPSILTPLNRYDSRRKSGLVDASRDFEGRDYWTSYETSWLNSKGVPENKILNLSYSCNSKFFVESKSLKLYLYSLNNKKFNSIDEARKLLEKDLQNVLKTDVEIELNDEPRDIKDDSVSIDKTPVDSMDSHPNALVLEPGDIDMLEESLSCSLFRSLCPVTAQPDWATIYIYYKGNSIQHSGLLRYLLSFRNHQGFHEECVERIFVDILKRCRLDELCVRANFLRRGGIEINPLRSTPGVKFSISREIRQ